MCPKYLRKKKRFKLNNQDMYEKQRNTLKYLLFTPGK